MRALIVFESMFGNTRKVAEAIGAGLAASDIEVTIRSVADVSPSDLVTDLVVVGGPTHAHSMSRPSTRRGARDLASAKDSRRRLDPSATHSTGVREWLASVDLAGQNGAAFDTRMRGPAPLTGRAAKSIARRLRRAGATVVGVPTSFLVTKSDELVDGEIEHATEFGRVLARRSEVRRVA